jgi:hypothetical protein
MTSQWNSSISLRAMALNVPDTPGHPNKHSFSGTLTRIGELSDGAPWGSNGRRVMITRTAAEHALPSLLGMAVNLTTGANGHAVQQKCGIITSANIVGNEIHVAGHLFAADCRDQVERIVRDQGKLGMSYEAMDLTVEDPGADPLVITNCMFSGAAILLRHEAAYRSTRIAAAAEDIKSDDLLAGIRDFGADIQKFGADTRATLARMDRDLDDLRRRMGR